jgi:hypothetical protein
MSPAEVLRKAADLIEERGWWNGENLWADSYLPPVGGVVCAALAIKSFVPWNDAFSALAAAVGPSVGAWNDAQPNGEVVIAKLREVADELERAS